MLRSFKKTFLVNLIVAVVIFLLITGVTLWLASDINKRTAAIQEARQDINLRLRAIESLASLKKDAPLAQRELAFLNIRLPIQDRLIDFPKDMTALARNNNIELGFSFGSEVAGSETEPGYLSFTMTAGGDFSNWLSFIRGIENSRYLISFDNFNIAREDDSFKSVLNGKVYSQ